MGADEFGRSEMPFYFLKHFGFNSPADIPE